MKLEEYQNFVKSTAHKRDDAYWYACLGMAGETGEVIEIIKKVVRDKESVVDSGDLHNLRLEIGDVLWYMTRLLNELGLTLDEVIAANVEKLTHRRTYGKNK